MLRLIATTSDLLNSLVEKVTILLISVITILTIIGVSTRYIFNFPIIWLYETTLVNFVWLVFLGVSIAFKRHEHISLDFAVDRVPQRFSKIFQLCIACIVLGFLLIGIKEGIQIVRDTAAQYYHTIHLSTAWFYASFPVSAFISSIHLLNDIVILLFTKDNQTIQLEKPQQTVRQ